MKRHLTTITAATLTLAGAAACSSSEATHSANTKAGSPAVGTVDRTWLAQTHQANLAEVRAGELAEKKATRRPSP